MPKSSTIAAIDVGTTKVCTIVADHTNGGLRVIGVGITPSYGMHKGLVVNINDAKDAIRESVKKAEQATGNKIESAYIGVTGRSVNSVNNKGVISITRNDRLVRPNDLKRVMESARAIKVPSDRRLLHVIPRSYALDGQEMSENPVGMHGARLDVEAHIITAAITSVQNLVKCINGVGIDVDDLILEPLASAEAVLTEEEKQFGVIIADIGGGTTDMCVFRQGTIFHTAVIPVAGYQFTRDLAVGLGLPFEVAEQMKKRYGSVMPVYDTKAQTPQAMAADGHGVSYQDLCDIIRVRVEELVKLIVLELPTHEYEQLVPAGLVFSGGSSNLAGIDALARDMLRLPVRVGVPSKMDGISEQLCNPAYSTSVGLLLWAMRHEGAQTWGQRPPVARVMQRFMVRFQHMFGR